MPPNGPKRTPLEMVQNGPKWAQNDPKMVKKSKKIDFPKNVRNVLESGLNRPKRVKTCPKWLNEACAWTSVMGGSKMGQTPPKNRK